MKSRRDVVSVKEEPEDSWSDAGDDTNFDSMDFYQVKNYGTSPHVNRSVNYMNEDIVSNQKLDESISIEFECQDVKLEPPSPLKSICTSDYESCLPIVKLENGNQTDDTSGKKYIDFDSKHFENQKMSHSSRVNAENKKQTNHLNGKSLIILIEKNFDFRNNCLLQENSQLQLDELKDVKIVEKRTQTKLSHNYKVCKKTYNKEASLKRHSSTKNSRCRLFESRNGHKLCGQNTLRKHMMANRFECDICHKSFTSNDNLKNHINEVHNHSKPFECDICQKSFGRIATLKRHTITVHDRQKPFKCDTCHKSFGQKSHLYTHINAVHNQCKSFKCEICYKSFEEKGNFNRHINAVHEQSKPFECDICKKSFTRNRHLKNHINEVHNHSKPYECNICSKSFGRIANLKRHTITVHDRQKPFECDICHKSFGHQNALKNHRVTAHNLGNPFK